jgi:di/tricarboxylate transporter
LLLCKVFPPGVTAAPEAPEAARQALSEMGPLSRDEKITALIFSAMVAARM